jgi:hypothetical protein
MSLYFHDSLFADFSFARGKSIRCLSAQLRTSFRLGKRNATTATAIAEFGDQTSLVYQQPDAGGANTKGGMNGSYQGEALIIRQPRDAPSEALNFHRTFGRSPNWPEFPFTGT